MNIIDTILGSFGYVNSKDGLESLFGGVTSKFSFVMAMSLGSLSSFIDEFSVNSIGIEGDVYISLIALFVIEFLTGVYSSVVRRGEPFESNKLGRIIIKIVVYSFLLIIFNNFKSANLDFTIVGFNFDFFEWTYYIVLSLLILQLIVSVLENLRDMGFKELSPIIRIFKSKVKKISDD